MFIGSVRQAMYSGASVLDRERVRRRFGPDVTDAMAALDDMQRELHGLGHGQENGERRDTDAAPAPPPYDPYNDDGYLDAAGTPRSAFEELRDRVPFLAPAFSCSDDDAAVLLAALATSSGPATQAAQDDTARLQAELKVLRQRCDSRGQEIQRLRDDVGEARQKQRAVEAEAKRQTDNLSHRREEVRRQLATEEGRVARLQLQNKQLLAEVDQLKGKLHRALGRH